MKAPAAFRLLAVIIAFLTVVALLLTLFGTRDDDLLAIGGLILACGLIYALAGVKRKR